MTPWAEDRLLARAAKLGDGWTLEHLHKAQPCAEDTAQPANAQPANGQCADRQCADGQCADGQCADDPAPPDAAAHIAQPPGRDAPPAQLRADDPFEGRGQRHARTSQAPFTRPPRRH